MGDDNYSNDFVHDYTFARFFYTAKLQTIDLLCERGQGSGGTVMSLLLATYWLAPRSGFTCVRLLHILQRRVPSKFCSFSARFSRLIFTLLFNHQSSCPENYIEKFEFCISDSNAFRRANF